MNRIVTITFFCLLLVSCSTVKNPFAKTQINYIGDSEYLPDSIPGLRDGTIVLDFISYYKCDTIKIKFGKTLKTVYLNTDDVTGYADIIVLGKINQRQSMELALNNFQAVTINADSINQLFVISYFPDTLLNIRSVFKLPKNE